MKQLLAAATLVAAALIATTPATAAPTDLTASNFQLHKTAYNPTIAALDEKLPKAMVPQVIDDANRAAPLCGSHASGRVASFCWSSASGTDDEHTSDWYPQGITTSADADPSGSYQNRKAILASWYWNGGGTERGARIAFVDYSNPSAPQYRVVLLVEPYTNSGGNPDFRAETTVDADTGAKISLHSGGITWYGHNLYVADTWGGFRVFDLDHLWRVDSNRTAMGLQSDGTYQAYSYKYVLPEAFRYTSSTTGYPALRYSAVSLDRTGPSDSVVVCEYNTATSGTHRVVRFSANPATFELGGTATEAYETGITHMQGSASVRGRFFASTSYTTSSSSYGSLYTFTRGESPTAFLNTLQAHPEDLSYWPATNALWSLSEVPGNRVVYAMDVGLLGWPTVKQGNTGNRVKTVQYLLDAGLEIDGDFGPLTTAAVKSFQAGHGITADGVVNAVTWRALVPSLRPGDIGNAVRALQAELTAHGFAVAVTGAFDQTTGTKVQAFEAANGLPATGMVDADTWKTLLL
ncbi:peptidoglycan-binding protein [Kribbella pittospori]|uniref:Peptidoglycan-binding protein n=1 Tax=Kribbella pittospori TaxID=722689 RepID=A0A4R0JP49_9ACTN|nr:peptidoglycan-binding protein [Kribbella pittospori]TCC48529.1 peptidoglycan-binding protein [Kribbella pittospori]